MNKGKMKILIESNERSSRVPQDSVDSGRRGGPTVLETIENYQETPMQTSRSFNRSTVQSQHGSQIYGSNQNPYRKPNFIKNQHLVRDHENVIEPEKTKSGTKLHTIQQMNQMYLFLKDDLIEHFDYEAMPYEVWKYLKAWYDSDLTLLRFVKSDKVYASGQLYVDLYPETRNKHHEQARSKSQPHQNKNNRN